MISISVKTNLKEKLGTLCVIDPNASMEDTLVKIQNDLGLNVEVTDLVRLLPPSGKQKHSVVRKPEFLTDVDFYLAILDGISDGEESDDEASSSAGRAAARRRAPMKLSLSPARRMATTPTRKAPFGKKVTPPAAKKTQGTKTSRRQKAVASVARATAAVNRNTAAFKKAPQHKRHVGSKIPLSAEDRQALASVKLDMGQFEHYLVAVEGITKQNVGVVVKQVKKLHDGEGIDYKHWKQGVVFKQGYVLRLSDNFSAMREEAVAFETKNGRDRGNGWLVRHPIRKVENYQRYLFENISNPPTNSFAASNINHAVVDVVIPPSDNFSIVKSDSEDEEYSESEADMDEGQLLF